MENIDLNNFYLNLMMNIIYNSSYLYPKIFNMLDDDIIIMGVNVGLSLCCGLLDILLGFFGLCSVRVRGCRFLGNRNCGLILVFMGISGQIIGHLLEIKQHRGYDQ